MKPSSRGIKAIVAALRRSRRPLALIAGTLIGITAATGAGAEESKCARMISGAPEGVRRLDAVRTCRGVDAGCAYVESAAGYGVLTLICPRSGVLQVVSADRLSALQVRDGALAGECRSGSWQRDAGLPGCYPARGSVAREP